MHRRVVQMFEGQMRMEAVRAAAKLKEKKRRAHSRSSKKKFICTAGQVIADCWKVLGVVGSGSFSNVYEVVHLNNGKSGALKIQSTSTQSTLIMTEIAVYSVFKKSRYCAELLEYGKYQQYRYIVTKFLGTDLSQIRRQQPSRQFSLNTVTRCSLQIISAIEELHSVGYIHRDLKPSNVAPGLSEDSTTLFIFDFGLCRKYVDTDGRHLKQRINIGFRGTKRYASIHAHDNMDLSRRDDMWSLLYSIIELTEGTLPWTNVASRDEVGKLKKTTQLRKLPPICHEEYEQILNHIIQLKFIEKPDYDFMKKQLNNFLKRKDLNSEELFDWQISSRSSPTKSD